MNAETRSRTQQRTSRDARRTTRWFGALAATLALAFVSRTAEAQFTTLHVFNGPPDGATPGGGLIRGADGNFYGSTQSGGTADLGTIYRITPAGVTTILHSFLGPEGADPFGELVRGTDGNFYGTTALGGSAQPFNGPGVIFRMTPAGAFTVLHIFDGVNGQRPQAGLVQGPDGNFYGVTPRSGATNNGVIFRITPGGVYTVLRSFTGADGSVPSGALIVGPGNNLFGVTAGGGTANAGTVYRITPAGVFTSLHSFTFAAGDGNNPLGALEVGADGNFYGTTEFGGTAGGGTTYRMTPVGVTTILHSFAGPEGLNPLTGLALASDGKFYGTTQVGGANNNGVVFSMTAAGAVVAVHSFVAPAEGSNPNTKVLQGADGALYGTTPSNGSGASPRGTVYRLAIAAGPATTTTNVQVNTGFFTEEDVILSTPASITALTLTITVQITPGLTFSGMFQNVFGAITQTHVTGPTTITYTFVLQPGNTIPPGTFTFAAQMGTTGVVHNVHGDTFTLNYTSGGQSFSQSGAF
jgi:uncharacterized repeat protein (TIGR03803 family)